MRFLARLYAFSSNHFGGRLNMSTWGKLRFQLLQTNPGTNLDLLDSWLNARYGSVLEAADWTGIHARVTLETQGAYLSGTDTVTLTVGSATVAGLGTAWTLLSTLGQKFYRPGDEALYTVTAWTDATHLTLDRAYEGKALDAPGVIYAAAKYVFMQNVYALPDDCRSVERILNPMTGYPLAQFTPAEMDASAGNRTTVGHPQSWAEVEDTPEVDGGTGTLHQVELFPAPLLARGIPVEYLRSVFAFDGTNLSEAPLPFVSDAVILYGVRADIAIAAGKLNQAQGYELLFKQELARLLMVEFAQRRAKPAMQMADRFTRHRFERAIRGGGRR
jgi:hypothetical protein